MKDKRILAVLEKAQLRCKRVRFTVAPEVSCLSAYVCRSLGTYLSGCLIKAAAAFSQSTRQLICTTQPPLFSPSFSFCS